MKTKEEASLKNSGMSRRGRWIILGTVLTSLTSIMALGGIAGNTSNRLSGARSLDDASGRVLPPHARPNGYSLSAIAKATAFFNTGARTGPPPDLPCLAEECAPLQILFAPNNGATLNTFSVSPGTILYVPVILNDDSPPIIGSCPITATTCPDFPNVGDREEFLDYMYSPKEFGLRYSEIVVDGKVHDLGSDYLVEVKVPVPAGLADGSGTQYMTSAAFVAPLSEGTHTVEIRANANGQDVIEVFTALSLAVPFPFTITYTVNVH